MYHFFLQDVEEKIEPHYTAMFEGWMKVDMAPWLASARSGLLGSGILSRLPQCPIYGLHMGEKEKSKLDALNKGINNMAEQTAAILANTADSRALYDSMAFLRNLHKSFATHVLFKDFHESSIALMMSLQNVCEAFYAVTFTAALKNGASVLEAVIRNSVQDTSKTFGAVDESRLPTCVEMCNKANYLLSGLSDVDTKQNVGMAVKAVQYIASAAFHFKRDANNLCPVLALETQTHKTAVARYSLRWLASWACWELSTLTRRKTWLPRARTISLLARSPTKKSSLQAS